MHIYWYLNTYILFNLYTFIGTLKEEFEDTKGVMRFRKSKDKQHNDQKKKKKRIYKTLHRKLKIEQHNPPPPLKTGVNSGAPEGLSVPAPHATPVVLYY